PVPQPGCESLSEHMYTVRHRQRIRQPIRPGCARFHRVNSRTPSSRTGRSNRASRSRSRDTLSREERKEATRRAIVAASLRLLEDRSFAALSLREVTREAGIVPAAFYRHFESMEALGLVLIYSSIRRLSATLPSA